MQTQAPSTSAPPQRVIIPAGQGDRASTTPASLGATPTKVEGDRQCTRLTSKEHENLRRIGWCFRSRQVGHIAKECPRTVQISNIVNPDSPPALTNPFPP
jgi:hypothetical protein